MGIFRTAQLVHSVTGGDVRARSCGQVVQTIRSSLCNVYIYCWTSCFMLLASDHTFLIRCFAIVCNGPHMPLTRQFDQASLRYELLLTSMRFLSRCS